MNRTTTRILAGAFGILGLLLIAIVGLPMAINEAQARQLYPDLISPIPGGGRYGFSLLDGEKTPQLSEEAFFDSDIDYTKATNWFPTSVNGRQFASNDSISFYTVSIPKLNIENAAVAIGGEDLTNNIIQYPGTALPGKVGNAVLFGHSVLPYFFNPKDYLTIFSTLDKLEAGDEINIDNDGISYTYRVKEMFLVKPTDLYILDQKEDSPYLSLVTCFPMGDPRKPERLVVRAELVPPS